MHVILRSRHQDGIDHLDHAIRLIDVRDRDFRRVTLGIDLVAKSDLAVGTKTNDVKDFLANVDADRGQGGLWDASPDAAG